MGAATIMENRCFTDHYNVIFHILLGKSQTNDEIEMRTFVRPPN